MISFSRYFTLDKLNWQYLNCLEKNVFCQVTNTRSSNVEFLCFFCYYVFIKMRRRVSRVDNEEKKLTSSEIEDMLKEVEEIHTPRRTTNDNRKKKPKVRIDMIIAAVVAVAVIIGAVMLIMHFTGESDKATTKSEKENPLMDEKYPEISDVVKNYLEAYLIEDSQQRLEVLAQYVDNMGDINEGDISQNKYAQSYSEIECYTKEGPYENTYVVYAYYHMELKNIATSAPGISTLYVIRDSVTGNVYIHNGVTNDIEEYIKEVTKDEDVQELFKEVDKEFDDALASDEQLKAFFDKLQAEAVTTQAATQTETTQAAVQQTTQAATQPAATTQAGN